MKSFIKKVMIVVVILATVVDWPVETDAVNTKPIVKAGGSLLRSCSRETRAIEKNVNKATQATKEAVNEAATDLPSTTVKGVLKRGIHDNTQTSSYQLVFPCKQCKGHGTVQGNDGYVYSCSHCKGTGKIIIK